jgi:transposase-like protein
VFPPVSIVWPCSLSVDEYVATGREVAVPRPNCPNCPRLMIFWSGYRRQIREGGRDALMWVPRARCQACGITHALLPAFVVANRLDVTETIGAVLDEVSDSSAGVRPAAERRGIPHTTARGWVRRFAARSADLAVAFAALAVELGGEVLAPSTPPLEATRHALAAIRVLWRAASGLPGWLSCGRWRFICSITGGSFIATNTNVLFLYVGKRRFMPPVP